MSKERMGLEAAKRRYVGAGAFHYDSKRVKQPHWRLEHDAVASLLGDARTVLDAPVGTGRFMPLYKGRRVVGVDISEDMLVLARTAAIKHGVRDFELTMRDLFAPQFFPEKFDVAVVVRYLTLLHVHEALPALNFIAQHTDRMIVEVTQEIVEQTSINSIGFGVARTIKITDRLGICELIRYR